MPQEVNYLKHLSTGRTYRFASDEKAAIISMLKFLVDLQVTSFDDWDLSP
jgi:hypothetical protein